MMNMMITNKELVDLLTMKMRQRGIAASESNKLDFKKFVDIQSFEVERLNEQPTFKEQTAPKIEPSKLISQKLNHKNESEKLRNN